MKEIYTSATPKESEQRVRVFLQTIPVLPLNRTVAKRTALVRAELRRKGRSVRQRAFDIVIAATALSYDLTLVTRNVADYRAIDGLKLYRFKKVRPLSNKERNVNGPMRNYPFRSFSLRIYSL